MASDVEVLRELWRRWTGQPYMADYTPGEFYTALSSAISALEAREAQPKVEGRMKDERANELAHEAIRIEDTSLGPYEAAVFREIRKDWAGRRASEAALSERVATLETVLRRLDEGLDAAGVDPYCEGETTARDIIRETGAVPSRSFLALSPPPKPETHQGRVRDPARHAWVKPFSDGSDLCYQCRRPKSEHRETP